MSLLGLLIVVERTRNWTLTRLGPNFGCLYLLAWDENPKLITSCLTPFCSWDYDPNIFILKNNIQKYYMRSITWKQILEEWFDHQKEGELFEVIVGLLSGVMFCLCGMPGFP